MLGDGINKYVAEVEPNDFTDGGKPSKWPPT